MTRAAILQGPETSEAIGIVEIIRTVAHRLRERATAIEGSLPLLRASVGDETDESGILNELERSSQALCELVDELVDFSELESQAPRGKASLSLTPARDLVRRALGTVAEAARRRRILLSDRLPADLPEVRADRERLVRALTHVFSALLKRSPEGAVVTVEGHLDGSRLRLLVWADGGPAVVPGDISPDISGDLGLLIARRIIREHGGEIEAGSSSRTPSRGSCLSILLPPDGIPE